jgi:hypothetical protein
MGIADLHLSVGSVALSHSMDGNGIVVGLHFSIDTCTQPAAPSPWAGDENVFACPHNGTRFFALFLFWLFRVTDDDAIVIGMRLGLDRIAPSLTTGGEVVFLSIDIRTFPATSSPGAGGSNGNIRVRVSTILGIVICK